MGLLLMAHSLIRWLVVAVALLAAIVCAIAWMRKPETTRDRAVMSAFLGVLDLQALLGLALLLWSGFAGTGFPMYRIEHGMTLLIAVAVAHLSARWKRAPSAIRARNNLLTIMGVCVLVFAGISRLPQGW
ncbi:MAG TPA: hypothetical protein VFT99_24355 [Roseiflexaceae bacterium]|nr:hypothetical protein [Roseiflexaceae bacterium]